MITRRTFLGTSLGAGAALALAPELLSAPQGSAGTLMQRAIPSSGEMLPGIGLGRRSRLTVAHAGTANPAHMLENIGGGIGRLPVEAMRKRMAAWVDSLPPTS